MITTVLEGVGLGITAYIVYATFFSDYLANKAKQNSKKSAAFSNAEKLAKVKAVSDDPRDIEKFIAENVAYLDNTQVDQLVCRIESLKADRVINGDNLKTRIDALEAPEEIEEVVEKPKARGRKK